MIVPRWTTVGQRRFPKPQSTPLVPVAPNQLAWEIEEGSPSEAHCCCGSTLGASSDASIWGVPK